MLHAGGLGVLTDGLRSADISNPRGYLEYERTKTLEVGDTEWIRHARGKVVKVIAYLLEFLPSGSQYKVVFVVRNLEEVLASQGKMLHLRGESDSTSHERMRELFYGHMARARRLLAADDRFEVVYVRHDAILDDPRGEAVRISHFLDRSLDVAAMAAAVDPALYRNRVAGHGK